MFFTVTISLFMLGFVCSNIITISNISNNYKLILGHGLDKRALLAKNYSEL